MRKITFLGIVMLLSLFVNSVKAQTTPLDLTTVGGSVTMGYSDIAASPAPSWITIVSLPAIDTKDGKCGTATATFAMKSTVSFTFYLTKCDQMIITGNIATGRGLTYSINGGTNVALAGTSACTDYIVPVNSEGNCTIKVSGASSSNAAYTSFFNFTYAPKIVPTISLSSGSNTQTVYQTQTIKTIVYQYGGNAISASIAWTGTASSSTAPDGVTVTTDTTAKTVTISGALSTLGSYGYSITSTDGTNTTTPLTGTLNTKNNYKV